MKHIDKLEAAKRFVIQEVNTSAISFESRLPWRRSGLHVLQHGLRVQALCHEIIKRSDLKVASHDRFILDMACILHDLGKIATLDGHGAMSANLSEDFLGSLVTQDEKTRIQNLLRQHSNKKNRDDDLILNILKDADEIDEFGVQSMMMSSQWINKETPFFFKDLEARFIDKELPFGHKLLASMVLPGAQEIVREKLGFLEQMVQVFEFENRGSMTYETYLSYLD